MDTDNLILIMFVWLAVLTAWLLGVSLRQNEIQRQLNLIHIRRMAEGLEIVDQDNQSKSPNSRG